LYLRNDSITGEFNQGEIGRLLFCGQWSVFSLRG